jgi:hypothetical protein
LLSACNQQKKPTIAFYYWKTIFKISVSEKATLSENQVQKLYIRYFDIDSNPITNQIFPQSPIHFEQKPLGFEIVPVIYIKNQIMLTENLDILDLAQKTYDYINQINKKNEISCQEIQIDCDWTLKSKDNYLKFIDVFKKISAKKLSATIRLHQIKYFHETKIPNVDKGVLMYYNMGKIAPDSLNSIYDKLIAEKYLISIQKYPLSINIALPIYSWAIHIRENKVLGLKNKLDVSEIKKDTNFIQIKNNFFRVKNNNYKNGTFYKTNDLLKFEKISSTDLLEMADDLKENLANNPEEIIFYDLDQFNTKQYEKDIFTQVINRF